MTAQLIAQLVVALGPGALQFIVELAKVWEKPELTPEEVVAMCAPAQKSYEEYIAEARAK